MANWHSTYVWSFRLIVDSDAPTAYGDKPLHQDYIYGIYETEVEARHAVEVHAMQNFRHGSAKTMKNLWVTVDRRRDGLVNSVSWHNTHEWKNGKREYYNTRFRYEINKHYLRLTDNP